MASILLAYRHERRHLPNLRRRPARTFTELNSPRPNLADGADGHIPWQGTPSSEHHRCPMGWIHVRIRPADLQGTARTVRFEPRRPTRAKWRPPTPLRARHPHPTLWLVFETERVISYDRRSAKTLRLARVGQPSRVVRIP